MFHKHSIMSLKKKSKSLGHLTALGSHPGSPEVEHKVGKHHNFAGKSHLPWMKILPVKQVYLLVSVTSYIFDWTLSGESNTRQVYIAEKECEIGL